MRNPMLLAAMCTGMILATTAAQAGDHGRHHRHHGWHHKHHGWHHGWRHHHRHHHAWNSLWFTVPVVNHYSYYTPPAYDYAPEPEPLEQAYNNTPARDDRYCREYTSRVQVGGRWQESYGTACMQPDGSWQIVD